MRTDDKTDEMQNTSIEWKRRPLAAQFQQQQSSHLEKHHSKAKPVFSQGSSLATRNIFMSRQIDEIQRQKWIFTLDTVRI